MYYTYMIRCTDNSIYTGITNDVEKRFKKHINGDGAKYTKSHKVEKIVALWRSKDKSLASKLEYNIKQLTKKQKEDLVINNQLKVCFKGIIDCRRYYRIQNFE